MDEAHTFATLGLHALRVVKKLKRYRTKKARPPKACCRADNRRALGATDREGDPRATGEKPQEKARAPPSCRPRAVVPVTHDFPAHVAEADACNLISGAGIGAFDGIVVFLVLIAVNDAETGKIIHQPCAEIVAMRACCVDTNFAVIDHEDAFVGVAGQNTATALFARMRLSRGLNQFGAVEGRRIAIA